LRLLEVRLSTSCVSNVLAGKPQKKKKTFLLLVAVCVFLRKKFLRHFLRVHYFWAVLYLFVSDDFGQAGYGAYHWPLKRTKERTIRYLLYPTVNK